MIQSSAVVTLLDCVDGELQVLFQPLLTDVFGKGGRTQRNLYLLFFGIFLVGAGIYDAINRHIYIIAQNEARKKFPKKKAWGDMEAGGNGRMQHIRMCLIIHKRI